MDKKVTTRFAPSPTGFLHIGGLRTALYAYLFAKKNNGSFLLRIEDTDQARLVEGATEQLQATLKEFGLTWDNQPPMIQSSRLAVYKQYAELLVAEGKAYRSFMTSEQLDAMRQEQQAKGLPPKYDRSYETISPQEAEQKAAAGEPHVIRFAMPQTGETTFTDIVRGNVSFSNEFQDDPVILKSDGFPTYHLANVIDDHEMEITHVIRGEEWLPSTPKHIALYKAFNWQMPQFAHLPLLLNPDKTKLSKRQGDVAAEDYLKKGYLKQALLNFILLLGWNPKSDQEIFATIDSMTESFSLENINKSGAVFDLQKLEWMNGYYIRELDIEQLTEAALPFFTQADITVRDKEFLQKVIATEQDRIKHLDEIVPATRFFFEQPEYESSLLVWKKMTSKDAQTNLKLLLEYIEKINESQWDTAHLETTIKAAIEKHAIKTGEALWPLRVALSGQQNSPGPFEIAYALGKQETCSRIKQAINKLQK